MYPDVRPPENEITAGPCTLNGSIGPSLHQRGREIAELLGTLAARGLRLHGFGVKTAGLEMAAQFLASSDSLAWSLGARKRFPGAQNSIEVAEEYRTRMLSIDEVC